MGKFLRFIFENYNKTLIANDFFERKKNYEKKTNKTKKNGKNIAENPQIKKGKKKNETTNRKIDYYNYTLFKKMNNLYRNDNVFNLTV